MHSFTSCLIHCVWTTKNREPWLIPDLREGLWPYLGGIARQNKMKTLAIGGAADHVHILLSLPATLSIAKATQLLKGNSSKCVPLPGRKATAHSALVFLVCMQPSGTWRSNGASPEAIFSREVHSDASEARFYVRGIKAQLRGSIVPSGTRLFQICYPSVETLG